MLPPARWMSTLRSKIFVDLTMIEMGVVAYRKPGLTADGHIASGQHRPSGHDCAQWVIAELQNDHAEEASQPGEPMDDGFSWSTHSVHPWAADCGEVGSDGPHPVRIDDAVCVYAAEDIAGGGVETLVAGWHDARCRRTEKGDEWISTCDERGAVPAPVVDDDNLLWRVALHGDGAEAVRKEALLISRRDHDRQGRGPRLAEDARCLGHRGVPRFGIMTAAGRGRIGAPFGPNMG